MRKAALVTGASRGIGRAIAWELAREGWCVGINYHTHGREAEELAAAIREAGCDAVAVAGDVADRAQAAKMVRAAEAELGPISLLVNNAGISYQGLFQDLTDAQWERSFAVNVGGARNAILAVLPRMISQQRGCIVNISSMWGLRGASCEVAYACTKAAIVGLTRSLALELAPSGIRVNAVAPGCIQTDMLKELGEETCSMLAQETPLGRLGTPEDVAQAVAFLASEKASFITGRLYGLRAGKATPPALFCEPLFLMRAWYGVWYIEKTGIGKLPIPVFLRPGSARSHMRL